MTLTKPGSISHSFRWAPCSKTQLQEIYWLIHLLELDTQKMGTFLKPIQKVQSTTRRESTFQGHTAQQTCPLNPDRDRTYIGGLHVKVHCLLFDFIGAQEPLKIGSWPCKIWKSTPFAMPRSLLLLLLPLPGRVIKSLFLLRRFSTGSNSSDRIFQTLITDFKVL